MLKFIGNGSAFSKNGNTSAYYKDGENMLLIDCGESVFQEILRKNLLEGVKNLVVLITHSHSDHCGSLSGLVWYCEYILKVKLSILAPKSVFEILDLMGNHSDSYNKVISQDHFLYSFGPFMFVAVSAEHQKGMDCFGYSMSLDSTMEIHNCYYSGDTKSFDAELVNALLENKLNELYFDVTEYDGDDNVHMNIDKLASLVPEKLRSSVYLMHFADNFNKQKALDLGFKLTEVE